MERQNLVKTRDELQKKLADLHSKLGKMQAEIASTEQKLEAVKKQLAAENTNEGHAAAAVQVDSIISLIRKTHKPTAKTEIASVETTIIDKIHDKRTKCLLFSPDGNTFVTSSLDGAIKLWDCDFMNDSPKCIKTFQSPNHWPEDIAFHSDGKGLFAVFNKPAIQPEHQLLEITFSEENTVEYLKHDDLEKIEGGIRRIKTLAMEVPAFVTAGVDRSVMLWKFGDTWGSTLLHNKEHTNEVTGLTAIMNQPQLASVGMDKRLILYDYAENKMVSNKLLSSPCFGIYANPVDPNLLCTLLKSHQHQLSLIDPRKPTPIAQFGWLQLNTVSQSSLIGVAWNPNGYIMSSGSSENLIHLFDIRINRNGPSQSIKEAHSKRVFKAEFHPTRPLMVSISDDFCLGVHSMGFPNV